MNAIDRETADAIYRMDLGAFACASVPIVNPGAELSLNWHIEAITYALQKMQSGRGGSRLVVNLPPRTLKSTIVSVCFVAWLLGTILRSRSSASATRTVLLGSSPGTRGL